MPTTAVRAVWLLLSCCMFAHPSGKQEGEEGLVLMRWNSLSKGLLILITCSGLGMQVGKCVWWQWPESRSGWAALGEAVTYTCRGTSVIHTHRESDICSPVWSFPTQKSFRSSKFFFCNWFFFSFCFLILVPFLAVLKQIHLRYEAS